jgi:hypothetical protein
VKYIISILFFLLSQFLSSKDWNINMYFKLENTKKIVVNQNEEYVQFFATANWEDSLGNFGILDCIGNMVVIKDSPGSSLYALCNGRNQNKDTFIVKFERSSDDIDTGIGYSTFLNGTGEYEDNIGLKCPYAVKFFEDRTFFKKKCKLK